MERGYCGTGCNKSTSVSTSVFFKALFFFLRFKYMHVPIVDAATPIANPINNLFNKNKQPYKYMNMSELTSSSKNIGSPISLSVPLPYYYPITSILVYQYYSHGYSKCYIKGNGAIILNKVSIIDIKSRDLIVIISLSHIPVTHLFIS
jgi:hypothetical protein